MIKWYQRLSHWLWGTDYVMIKDAFNESRVCKIKHTPANEEYITLGKQMMFIIPPKKDNTTFGCTRIKYLTQQKEWWVQ